MYAEQTSCRTQSKGLRGTKTKTDKQHACVVVLTGALRIRFKTFTRSSNHWTKDTVGRCTGRCAGLAAVE